MNVFRPSQNFGVRLSWYLGGGGMSLKLTDCGNAILTVLLSYDEIME